MATRAHIALPPAGTTGFRPTRPVWLAAIAAVLALIVTGVCPAGADAARPTVKRLDLTGVRRLPEPRVRAWISTRPGMPLDSLLVRQDLRRVLEGYRDAGYWQAAVAWPKVDSVRGGVAVRIRIAEGRITRIRSVSFEGDVAPDAGPVRLAAAKGAPLTPSGLASDGRRIAASMETRGYPFCAVRQEVAIAPGQDEADVVFRVESGPHVRVTRIRFEGNRTTRDAVLLREVRRLPGAAYDQREVDAALSRLRQLPFLVAVDEPDILPLQGEGYALLFRVEETPAAQIFGAVGYARTPGDATAGLTGNVSLKALNLAGTGRAGSVVRERKGADASGLELAYREPWLLGTSTALGGQVSIRRYPGFEEDQTALTADVALGGAAGVEAGLRHVRIRNADGAAEQFSGGSETGVEGAFRLDARDDRWNPTRGAVWRVDGSWRRVMRGSDTRGRAGGSASLGLFRPVARRSVLALALHAAGVLEGPDVPAVSRLRLGGAASIRGYAEETFLATTAFWANLEWRVPMGRRSRVYAFLDAGRLCVRGPSGQDGPVHPVGYGIGLLAESRTGLVGLGYGLARGERPGQGRLHLQLAGTF